MKIGLPTLRNSSATRGKSSGSGATSITRSERRSGFLNSPLRNPWVLGAAILAQGVERSSVVVDALLGTGVRGVLREPIRSAVELIGRARELGVPVAAVDTPTAVDLSSGEASDPVVRADLTITFHRPKTGLQTRVGRALAGRILVAPIGIPTEADRS